MFSKQMENLIQATLEDGKLEENEKAALIKRAQKEGIDLDELEIYINSLLQKRQRELNKENEAREEKHQQAKKEAFGQVCPNCGKQVPPLTLKCDCGYEFTNQKQVSSVKLLSEKLNSVALTSSEEKEIAEAAPAEKQNKRESFIAQKRIDIITTFPVPNTKEDIIEFLALAAPNSKTKGGLWGTIIGRIILLIIAIVVVFLLCVIFGPEGYGKDLSGTEIGFIISGSMAFFGGIIISEADQGTIRHNKMANAWRAKFDQVLMKGRSLRGDSEFTQQLDYYENLMNKK